VLLSAPTAGLTLLNNSTFAYIYKILANKPPRRSPPGLFSIQRVLKLEAESEEVMVMRMMSCFGQDK
jgi:hypothetical protein